MRYINQVIKLKKNSITDRVLFLLTKHQGGGYTLRVKLKRANLSKDRDANLQGLKLG